MKFCPDIHGNQKMNPNEFDDPMTFPLVVAMFGFDRKVSTTFKMDCHETYPHSCSPQGEL